MNRLAQRADPRVSCIVRVLSSIAFLLLVLVGSCRFKCLHFKPYRGELAERHTAFLIPFTSWRRSLGHDFGLSSVMTSYDACFINFNLQIYEA